MRSKPGKPCDHPARTSCAQANSRAWRLRQGMHGAHSLGLPATVKSFLHRRHFGLAWPGPAWPSMSRGRSMPDHEQPEPCLRSTCCAKYFARSWLKADCPVLLHMQKTGRSPLFISTNRLHLFPSQATLLRKMRTNSVWRRTPVLEKMERRWARAVLRRMLSASAASSSDRPLAS